MKYQLIEKNEKHVEKIVAALKKVRRAVPRDRPGPRGRSDLLARARGAQGARRARRQGRASRRVPRDHEARDSRSDRAAARISEELVNAQQARRALDYLVGFNLSPLLWKKVRRGAVRGPRAEPGAAPDRRARGRDHRVQGAGILDDRSRRREGAQAFPARLIGIAARRSSSSPSRTRQQAARRPSRGSATAARGKLTVAKIDKKQRRRNPAAPFTTSTLQQEASRKLGFSAQRTMSVAQRLYEGVDIGEGAVGLITYMRTDSVTLAERGARRDPPGHRANVRRRNSCPKSRASTRPRRRTRRKRTKPMRPTSAASRPSDVEAARPGSVQALQLIWKRTVASQMNPAVYDTVALDLVAGRDSRTRRRASVPRHRLGAGEPGLHRRLQEGQDDSVDDEQDRILPAVAEGDRLRC